MSWQPERRAHRERRRHDDPPGAIPFEAVSARIYVAKVKNLMLGLPPAEEDDRRGGRRIRRPCAAGRRLVRAARGAGQAGDVLEQAFQQTQIGPADFFDQITVDDIRTLSLFTQLQESMSRMPLKTIANGQPFTDTVTTHTIMMTPTMMSLYLALDQLQVDDAGKASLSCPCPMARSARRRRSGSPTGRLSIRARRRWWRTRSRSPRR